MMDSLLLELLATLDIRELNLEREREHWEPGLGLEGVAGSVFWLLNLGVALFCSESEGIPKEFSLVSEKPPKLAGSF